MRRLLGIALAGALGACRSPTQISVEVSTNVSCASWQGAAVAVGELGPSLETKPASTTSTFCDDAGYLGTVVAIPSGAENANVAFRVVGAVGQTLEQCTVDASTGCIVARRALNFIPHESLCLSVPLVAACEGVLCDPSSTCVEGQCRPATIPDPGQCADQTCGEGALTEDGGVTDATLPSGDGATEAGGDATIAEGGDAAEDTGTDAPSTVPDAAGADVSVAGCGDHCALALGDRFSCAIREAGVWCWGQNVNGECGTGEETTPMLSPGPVTAGAGNLSGVGGILSGTDTSCGFVADGGIACWGAGSPLGLAASDATSATTEPFLAGAPFVSIGNYHMCWGSGAQLSCECATGCGDGSEYQAFDGDGGTGLSPLAVPPGLPLQELVSTYAFSCILSVDGAVYCLGQNDANEADPGPTTPTTVPAFEPLPFDGGAAQEIAARFATGCLRNEGNVFCWGAGDFGENAAPSTASGQGVYEVQYATGGAVAGSIQLAAGAWHFCALIATGQVACWGNNANNELGRGFTDGGFSSTAALVMDSDGGVFGGVATIAAGTSHTCAQKKDGSVWCWGWNNDGQVSPGAPLTNVPTPMKIF